MPSPTTQYLRIMFLLLYHQQKKTSRRPATGRRVYRRPSAAGWGLTRVRGRELAAVFRRPGFILGPLGGVALHGARAREGVVDRVIRLVTRVLKHHPDPVILG